MTMRLMKRLHVACSCRPEFGGDGDCTRRTHHVAVYFRKGPLCVAQGRDRHKLWLVYHVPTGYAYPHDFTSKAAAKKALLALIKAAGETWWSQTDVKAMAADKKTVKKCSKIVPLRFVQV